ncbi:MAG TPA: carbon storage regulator [Terriglobia bacterium]|nr:carbon storage regulator [Terriglobia bacterium]
MLIISRKRNQKIFISDDIELTVLQVGRNRVRVGIQAPKHIAIQTRLKTSPPLVASDVVKLFPIKTAKPA